MSATLYEYERALSKLRIAHQVKAANTAAASEPRDEMLGEEDEEEAASAA
jgi:hypothetical protein